MYYTYVLEKIVPFYYSGDHIIVVHVGFMKFQQTYCIENWINDAVLLQIHPDVCLPKIVEIECDFTMLFRK